MHNSLFECVYARARYIETIIGWKYFTSYAVFIVKLMENNALIKYLIKLFHQAPTSWSMRPIVVTKREGREGGEVSETKKFVS